MLRAYIGFLLLLLYGQTYSQTLIINEVSQGVSGAQEYVELLVVGTPGCSEIPCLDLRGWIIDDNNGQFQTGTGTGIAQGAVRFTQDDFWSCIPIGTTILIYNDAELNVDLPVDDLSMDDGNCTLTIPISSTLFETHPSLPNATDSNYPTTGWVAGGNWQNISMNNSNDSFQIYDPTDMTTPVFSVSWGNNTDNNNIYFSGSASGNVFYLADGDYMNQASWVEGDVTVDQTPGGSNTSDNADWISSMNNGCQPLVPIEVTGTNVDPSCNGECDGSIDLTTTGGTDPLSFSWDSGQTTEDISGLCTGSYILTITDVNGCTKDTTITLIEPDPIVITETHIDVSCNGGVDGSIDATISGGTAPLTYSWSDGSTTEDLSGLSAGDYTLTVTDANGCTETITVTIIEPNAIAITETHVDVGCYGDSDGSIDPTITGGTAPLTYSWSNGSTTEDISGLIAGDYTLNVTDANSCVETITVTIAEPDPIQLSQMTVNVTCNGGNDGLISITTSGGTSPYTYLWSNGETTEDLYIGLTAGDYTLTTTDANSCIETVTITITEPEAIVLTPSSQPSSCGNNDGEVSVSAVGGSGIYTYSWLDGNTNEVGTTATVTGLEAGIYTVTVNDGSCTETATAIVSDAGEPTLVLDSYNDVTCNAACDGEIFTTASGGTAPITYSWNSGETTDDISGLCPGTYNLTASDANGCTATLSVDIVEPNAIVLTESHIDVTCNGGTDGAIDVTIAGGTSPYSYSWDSGQTTEDISGLTVGDYTLTVTDANSCTETITISIGEPDAVVLTEVHSNVTCFSLCDGTIDMSVSGGTGPYSYSWNTGESSQDLIDLCPGDYTITVTDANLCVETLTTTITEPTEIVLTTSSNPSTCGNADGEVSVSVIGGSGTYTYAWVDNGGNGVGATATVSGLEAGAYTVLVNDGICEETATVSISDIGEPSLTVDLVTNTSCFEVCDGSVDVSTTGGIAPITYAWNSGEATEDISNLCAGTYTLTATDGVGCVATIVAEVTEPENISMVVITQDVLCNSDCDGSIDMTVSGGTEPYSYSWDNGELTEDLSGLCPGDYNVQVTDANGCTSVSGGAIAEPNALTLTGITTNVSSIGGNNGSIDITVTGGTAPYSYSWDNGSSFEDLSGLIAGTYCVTVTDANGCIITDCFIITQPQSIDVVLTGTDITCFNACDGQVDLVINTPGDYTITWTQTGGTESGNQMSVDALCPQTISVLVEDNNSSESATATVILSEPEEIILSGISSDVSCFGSCDGSADITIVSGGVAPISYDWAGAGDSPTSSSNTGLCAGTYPVVVTDANGCIATIEVVITEPSQIVLSETHVDVTCFGACDGSIDVTTVGGTAPYSYSWDNGSTTEDISNLCSGDYTLTITDANGCIETISVSIIEPSEITLTTSSTLSSCGNADGSVSVNASGGSETFTYSWEDINNSEVGTTATVSGLAAGAYTVTVNDGQCETGETVSVSDAGEPEAVIDLVQDPTCFNACDGLIEVTTITGVAPFSYQWNNGSTTEDIIDLCAGTYSLTITDANGCVEVLQATLTDPEAISLLSSSTSTLCAGSCDGEGEVTVTSGGVQPFTYDWSGAGISPTSSSNTGLCVGTYPVIITDANFCSETIDVTVQEPQAIILASTSFDLTCYESCDGQVIVIPSGGTENGNGYNIQWVNDGQIISTEASVSNLCAGDYIVTVTDDNECTESITESITQPDEIILTLTQDSANCNMSDGTATVSVVGGVQPLNVYWDNGSQDMVNNNVAPGMYCVTVMDANACVVQDCIDVENIEGPSLTVVSTDDPDCFDSCDGSIEVDHIGGNSDVFTYTYSFNNGGNQVTSNPLVDLCEGSYTITGTDEHGCIATIDANLIAPEEVVVLVLNDTTICIDGCADLSAIAAGGIGTYSYEWSTNENTPEITVCPSENSSYSVIAMDGNGCFSSPQTVNVNLHDSLNLALFTIGPNYVCPGEEITIDADYNGGSGLGYSLAWNPVPDNQMNPQEAPVNFTPDGTIMIEATLSDNCETPDVSFVIEIGSYSLDSVEVTPQTEEGCEPLLVSFNTNVTNPNYVYSWDFGDGETSTEVNPTHTYDNNGSFIVDLTVTDDNGCTFEINNSSEIDVYEGSQALLEVELEDWDLLNNNIWFDASKSWNTEEYLWNFGDGYSSDGSLIQYAFEDTGSHVVSLITVSPDGCIDSTLYELEIDPIYTFFAPNAFSPNGDGMNDVFLPQGEGINTEDFEMFIYNRWGEMIYHVTDYTGWDGTTQQGANLPVQIDVYIWYIRTYDPWGNTHTYVGEVAVVR